MLSDGTSEQAFSQTLTLTSTSKRNRLEQFVAEFADSCSRMTGEQVHGLYLYRVIYNLGTMNLSISASWFASATLIILALPLGLIFARIMGRIRCSVTAPDFLQTSHNRCCEFFLIAAVLLFIFQRQRVLACLMDHFLATAQHNAIHLLEMVQDIILKLLKRQQNAQLIVIFLQLAAGVLTVESHRCRAPLLDFIFYSNRT